MSRKKAIFIDIDNTIIHGSSLNILVKYCYDKKFLKLSLLLKSLYWYLLYKLDLIKNFDKISQKVLIMVSEIVGKITVEEVNAIFKDCFETQIKPKIYAESEEFLRASHKNGYIIYFISSTITPLAKLLQNYFGFGIVVATEIEEINGYYTGNVKGPICYGIEKLNRIEGIWEKENIDLKESYAFSDHISDTPMLNKVGHPIVVNPSRKLKEIAIKHHWEIKNYSL
ncbi:MAG: hypothetical protein A2Y40_08220 [Candidatus Margulisbacteria bacterium GWF2_35_9]|nr:MAG: hypothetical protein A2Y40_08220 [Candidatus Margulisbacteria bacterium GWF2_35_9]